MLKALSVFLMFGVLALSGCGHGELLGKPATPSSSPTPPSFTVTVNPTSFSVTDDLTDKGSWHIQLFSIIVKDGSGFPVPEAGITIFYPWAAPDSRGVVQFYNGDTPVDSPMTAVTDMSGVYTLKLSYYTQGTPTQVAYTGDLQVTYKGFYGSSTISVVAAQTPK